jgi:hypothetical protein
VNLTELAKALELIGIQPQVLALGDQAENSWCVVKESDETWEVFWMERGNKIGLVRHRAEADACFQLLGRLAYSQLAAGVIGRQ